MSDTSNPSEESSQALGGLRVLEIGQQIAGPYCAKLLADLGADVLKLERPGVGDGARRAGPFPGKRPDPEASGLFLFLNTNKRSLTLDLSVPAGRDVFLRLVREADALVENNRPGKLEAWGLAPAALWEANPDLVITHISSFGQDGPYRDYQATELIFYALSGMQYITGRHDREPLMHGLGQAQYLAGVNAASATLAALFRAWPTGAGAVVDISIAEMLTRVIFSIANQYAYGGTVQRREPNNGAGLPNSSPVACSDGYVLPSHAGISTHWDTFPEFMGLPELKRPEFEPPTERILRAHEVAAIVEPAFAARSKRDWFHQAQEWRFPFAVVQDAQEILACPQLAERQFFVEMEHPSAERYKLPGPLFRLSESRQPGWRPAPRLGQHAEAVLCGELGLSQEQLHHLRRAGVV
ncbi:MAG: CoA transferase [Chloroflexi bacterium]|nr:CoA transferase [Chloroflexota bacterium]